MTWYQTAPTILVAALIVFVPGAVVARCIGARGLSWLGASAPLSVTLIGLGAIAAQMVHIRWSLAVLVVLTVAAAAVAAVLRYAVVVRRRPHREQLWTVPSRAASAGLLVGLAVGILVIGARFSRMFIRPEYISQTYDNVFHLNAVRFILDTGRGSSLYLGSLDPNGPPSFYPGAWHDLVALVVGTTHVSIPVGTNCVNIVLGAFVWTVSVVYLTSRVGGSRPAIFIMSGVLAGAFSAFPYLLVDFGVLYPNFLAVTLLPALIGLVADVLRLSARPRPGTAVSLILLLAALPGLALGHPSVLMALGAFALAPWLVWLFRQIQYTVRGSLSWPWLAASVVTVAVYVTALIIAWNNIRPSDKASFWKPRQTVAQAIGEAISNAPQARPVSWVVLILTAVGIYALLRSRKHVWLLWTFGISVFLFVVVTGFAKDDVRSFFTQVWYNDSNRLAALLPVLGAPIVVYGAVWLYDQVCRSWREVTTASRGRRVSLAAAGCVMALAITVAAQDESMSYVERHARQSYDVTPNAVLLSGDELELLNRLDSKVPATATVIENPGTGGALAYALANRQVILPAVGPEPGPLAKTLISRLSQLKTDPAVCQAVRDLNAYYVLDFGHAEVNQMVHTYPSSAALAATPGLELIDQQGPAKLYQVKACR